MLALARLGDMDGAYRLADALYPSRRGRSPAKRKDLAGRPGTEIWFTAAAPAAAPLRRGARYIALAEGVGARRILAQRPRANFAAHRSPSRSAKGSSGRR